MGKRELKIVEIYLQPASLSRWAYIRPMSPIPMIPMDLLSLLATAIVKGLLCGSFWQLVSRYPRQLFLTCKPVGQVCLFINPLPRRGKFNVLLPLDPTWSCGWEKKEKWPKGKIKNIWAVSDLNLLHNPGMMSHWVYNHVTRAHPLKP